MRVVPDEGLRTPAEEPVEEWLVFDALKPSIMATLYGARPPHSANI